MSRSDRGFATEVGMRGWLKVQMGLAGMVLRDRFKHLTFYLWFLPTQDSGILMACAPTAGFAWLHFIFPPYLQHEVLRKCLE